MIFYDGLERVLSQANVNPKVILFGDLNANINPLDGASDEAIVGPYGCWKRPTNDNGLWLLDLCGRFGLVLTNTLNNIKMKDIFTYKDKGPHGVCTSYYTLSMAYCVYCTRPEGTLRTRASAVKYAIRHIESVW